MVILKFYYFFYIYWLTSFIRKISLSPSLLSIPMYPGLFLNNNSLYQNPLLPLLDSSSCCSSSSRYGQQGGLGVGAEGMCSSSISAPDYSAVLHGAVAEPDWACDFLFSGQSSSVALEFFLEAQPTSLFLVKPSPYPPHECFRKLYDILQQISSCLNQPEQILYSQALTDAGQSPYATLDMYVNKQ